MKFFIWVSFYFLSFFGLVVGIYLNKDNIHKKTKEVPGFNYTQYHSDAVIADTSFTESIDSLAVVIAGLLGELTEYVSQVQGKDLKIFNQENEMIKLKQEIEKLRKKNESHEAKKIEFNKSCCLVPFQQAAIYRTSFCGHHVFVTRTGHRNPVIHVINSKLVCLVLLVFGQRAISIKVYGYNHKLVYAFPVTEFVILSVHSN